MANILLVYTMKGSVVMAKMAGTESTANTRSTNSIKTSARNSGVAQRSTLPVTGSGSRTQKALPRRPVVIRNPVKYAMPLCAPRYHHTQAPNI